MSKSTTVLVIKNASVMAINRAVKCNTYTRDHLKKKENDPKRGLYFYGMNEKGKFEKVFLY